MTKRLVARIRDGERARLSWTPFGEGIRACVYTA